MASITLKRADTLEQGYFPEGHWKACLIFSFFPNLLIGIGYANIVLEAHSFSLLCV